MSDPFWSTRDSLEHVAAVARSRGVGPWAVLGATLARAVAGIPPSVALPPVVGSRRSVNLFVALVGASGAGKGASESAAADGFHFGKPVDVLPLGSGEGIARTFRPIGGQAQEAAILVAPEIDTLSALGARLGSTLSAELRKAYSGEALGFANAGRDTRVTVDAHAYRCCLLVGVQPLRSGPLLDAADGGMPQRFVWLPTTDPDAPDDRPPHPGRRTVRSPVWPVDSDVDLVVPDVVADTIRAHRLAVLRESPDVDPLDGHALLTRLKVAAGLMALDGRTVIDSNDWELAGYVMAVSDRTRKICQHALTGQSRRANTARALAAAEREEIVSERKTQRCREAVLRRLSRHPQQTLNQIRMGLKIDVRGYLGGVIEELIESGEIQETAGKYYRPEGHMYQGHVPEKHTSTSNDRECPSGTHVPSVPTPLTVAQQSPPRRRERTRGKFQQTSGGPCE